jgi:hypothetical protein
VTQLLKRCCSHSPKLRPSAASIAEAIFDFWIEPIQDLLEKQGPEYDAIPRVQEKLDLISSNQAEVPEMVLSKSESDQIRLLCANGDVVANFLMGAALWAGIARPANHESQVIFAARKDPQKVSEQVSMYAVFSILTSVVKANEPQRPDPSSSSRSTQGTRAARFF